MQLEFKTKKIKYSQAFNSNDKNHDAGRFNLVWEGKDNLG